MSLIFGTLRDPLFQRFNLCRCQFFVCFRRRHLIIRVLGHNTLDQLAGIYFARNDRRLP